MAVNGKPRKIDYDSWSKSDLIKRAKILEKRKKYGIVWDEETTKEIFEEEVQHKLPVLNEIKEKEIITDFDSPVNILVEGDNYHVLSVLNYTHKGKIDVIYIDPPYNTGARDWKYNNDYVDINDAYRHSKWLSLVRNRLRLIKPLLRKNGIIIITIDDNEMFHLGTLLEEMFPSYDRFIITIEHNKRGRRGKNFAITNEWAIFLIPKGMELIQEQKSEQKIGGETRNLRRTGSGSKRTERPRKFFPIWVNKKTLEIVSAGDPIPKDSKWEYEEKGDLTTVFPIDEEGREKNWHYGINRTRLCIERKELEARKRDYGIQIYYTLREKESKKYKTVWTGSKFDASTYGSVLLEKILGEAGKFEYPKSLYAVIECMIATTGNRKNAVILDFFAGSGTTGHAVLELNKRDNGNRRFILCTNNENNICTEVTYPRISNVIKGYKFKGKQTDLLFEEKITYSDLMDSDDLLDNIEQIKLNRQKDYDEFDEKIEDGFLRLYGIKQVSDHVDGLGGNLKYFKTEFVGWQPTDKNKRDLVERSTEMLCLKESCFELVKKGDQFNIFKNHEDRYLGIIYYYDGIEPFKKEAVKLNKKINTYVFSLSDVVDDEEFQEVDHLVNLKPIPASILNVYRWIFAYVQTKKLPREADSGTNG